MCIRYHPFHLTLNTAVVYYSLADSFPQSSMYGGLPNLNFKLFTRRNPVIMLIVQNYANNSRSVSRITCRSHVYLERRAASKWLTTAANDTQDMGIDYSGFLCVCVSFLAVTGHLLKWQLAAAHCNHTDQSQGSILFMPERYECRAL